MVLNWPKFSLMFLTHLFLYAGVYCMGLVIANSVLRASLAIYHLISNARSWGNC